MDVEPHVADGSTSICFSGDASRCHSHHRKPAEYAIRAAPAHVLNDAAATAQLLLRSP
jgi:hypothetical protein